MQSTMINQPRKGEFFELEPDARRKGKGHGVVFENEQALLTPPRLILLPKAGGFPPLRETPRLVYHPHQGVPPPRPRRWNEWLLAGFGTTAPSDGNG